MKIRGLKYVRMAHKDAIRAIDLVKSYQTYAVGGGDWSIEAKTTYDQSVWGPSIKAWTGSNGTRYGEEKDDLWKRVREWEQDPEGGLKVVREAYSYKIYESPDGTRASFSFFKREILAGRMHGCIISF